MGASDLQSPTPPPEPDRSGGKLWAGRFSEATAQSVDAFNSSIAFDWRLWAEDIEGSRAHAAMLHTQGLLSAADAEAIDAGLEGIARDIAEGRLAFDPTAEDIHMFVEAELTRRIGEAGKRLHTARSRNDQVATDIKLWLRRRMGEIRSQLVELALCLVARAAEAATLVMPGYTHLQRAQPVTAGFVLMAHAHALARDLGRLDDAVRRGNRSPLGAAALAGSGYPLDREMTAAALGFDGAMPNAMDAVSDRDFLVESTGVLALLMVHLSRLAEEIVLWSSQEFGFVELADAYATGSSIMPQKKNPDVAELSRGRAARVISDLNRLLVLLKGLPLAYNKDLQEDKEALFDAVDSVQLCLPAFTGMVATMRWQEARLREAAARGFTNATDLADYLVGRGLAFRDAHHVVGRLVAQAMEAGVGLEALPFEALRAASERIERDVYDYIDLDACVARRGAATGGPAPAAVREDAAHMRALLQQD